MTQAVCDARRPIGAIAALVDRGCRVELGEISWIWCGIRRRPLKRIGNTFVLMARTCHGRRPIYCLVTETNSYAAQAARTDGEMKGGRGNETDTWDALMPDIPFEADRRAEGMRARELPLQ